MAPETMTTTVLTHPYQVMLVAVVLFHAVRAVVALLPRQVRKSRPVGLNAVALRHGKNLAALIGARS